MQTGYFDIHSHLNLKPLLDDQDGVIGRMHQAGVKTITVGVDFNTSKMAIELAEKYPNILWATIGMHPNDNVNEIFDYNKYLELAKNDKVVAIGETGLDYFRDQSVENKQRQKQIFIKHIELAIEVGKPLMIHARPAKKSMDAYEDVLNILESRNNENKLSVNFHFFVGDTVIAERIVKNGWTMSFDGPITFTDEYDEVIKSIPITNIMAETDAPFAAPAPYRGKTCEPHMVAEVYKKIANLKGLSEDECRVEINKNVERVFKIA